MAINKIRIRKFNKKLKYNSILTFLKNREYIYLTFSKCIIFINTFLDIKH